MKRSRARILIRFTMLLVALGLLYIGVASASASHHARSHRARPSHARRPGRRGAVADARNAKAVRKLGHDGKLSAETVEIKGITAHIKHVRLHRPAHRLVVHSLAEKVSGSRTHAAKAAALHAGLAAPLDKEFSGLDDNDIGNYTLNVGSGFSAETSGAAGPKYYGEAIAYGLGFFDKSTGALVSDEELTEFFKGSGVGAPCEAASAEGYEAPHLLYDSMSDRWIVMVQAATNADTEGDVGETYECVAASQTGDPVNGGWYFYKVPLLTGGALNVYASEASLWTDGVYFEETIGCEAANLKCPGYNEGEGLEGTQVWAFNRADLESGSPLRMQTTQGVGGIGAGNFTGESTTTTFSNKDADGPVPANVEAATGTPPAGRNEYFLSMSDLPGSGQPKANGLIDVWQWHVSWENPSESWIGQSKEHQTDYQVKTPEYGVPNLGAVSGAEQEFEILEGGPTAYSNPLNSQFDYIQPEPQYTDFAGTESLWITHATSTCSGSCTTKSTTGPDRVRFNQIALQESGAPVTSGPTQGQDYAPAPTTLNRFLPTIGIDKSGDMGLGYSGASSNALPSLYIAGQEAIAAAPAGTATISSLPETEVDAGDGYQTGSVGEAKITSFGPYNTMSLDPNGCELWFAGQTDVGSPTSPEGLDNAWATQITAFHFSDCTASTLATSLSVSGEANSVSSTGTLSAKLIATGTGSGVVGEKVSFKLGGSTVGSATTNSYGIATLTGVDTSAYAAGASKEAVEASYAGDAAYNYGSSTAKGALLVGQTQTISFSALPARTYGESSFTLSASASSGLPVSFSTSSPDENGIGDSGACSVAGTTVTITGAGICTITAAQPGDGASYLAAPPVSQSFDIAQETQTITPTGSWASTPQAIGTDFKASATASSGETVYFNAGANCAAVENDETPADEFVPTGSPTCIIYAEQDGTQNIAPVILPIEVSVPNRGAQTGKFAQSKSSYAVSALQEKADGVTWSSGLTTTGITVSGTISEGSIAAASTATLGGEKASTTSKLETTSTATCKAPTAFTVTATFKSADGFAAGETVAITGAVPAAYNNAGAVVQTTPSTTTLTYCIAEKPANATTQGSVKGVSSITESGTTATAYVTAAPSTPFAAGQKVNIAGTTVVSGTGYNNQNYTILSAPTTTSFTFTAPAGSGSAVAGTVGLPGTGASQAGGIATINLTAEPSVPLSPSGSITVAGVSQTAFNGTYTITSVPSATSFTYELPTAVAASGGGSISAPGTSCKYNTVAQTITALHAGTCTLNAEQAGNSSYLPGTATITYTLTQGTQSLTWSPLAGNLPASHPTKVSASTNSGLSAGTVTSTTPTVCTVESTTVSGGTSSVTLTPVAEGTCTLSASGNSGSLDWAALAAKTVTYTIGTSGSTQTITFGGLPPKTLAETPAPLTATASSGLPVSFASTTPTVCTVSGTSISLLAAGTCTISASQAGEAGVWAPATSVSESFAVSLADQVLIFGELPDVTYGSPDFALSGGLEAFSDNAYSPELVQYGDPTGLPVSYEATGACTVNPAGTDVHVTETGECTITASQAGNSIYNPAPSVAVEFAVLPDASSITFANPGTQAYGTPAFAPGATTTSGAPVTYTAEGSCSITLAGEVLVGAPGTCTVTAHSVGTGDYAPPAKVSQSFEVVKANQTIEFSVGNHTYGDPDFTISATATSGLPVSFEVSSGDCTLNGDTVHITGTGSCTITASQAGDADYNAAPEVADTFSIDAASQTITFPTIPGQSYGNPPVKLTATASSGLEVSYMASGPCAIAGDELEITGTGSCVVTAEQPGNSNYNAAAAVSQTVEVGGGAQTITFANPGTQTYGEPDFTPAATASSGLPVSFTAEGSCLITIGGQVHLTGAGTCTVTAEQPGNAVWDAAEAVVEAFEVTKASQTISFANPGTHTYGEPAFAPGADASSALAVSYEATGGCSIDEAELVVIEQPGSCMVTASQGGDGDYLAAPQASQTFKIEKASQTIAFEVAEHTYGEADFSISATATSGEAVVFTRSSGECTLNGSLVHLAGTGTCTIAANQEGNTYYKAAPEVSDTFRINAASQTITFPAIPSQTYGAADFSPGASASSGLPVEYEASGDCTIVSGKVHISSAGSCSVTASQAGNASYEPASSVTHTFYIAKEGQTITFNPPATEGYGTAPFKLSATASSGLPVSYSGTGSCTVTPAGQVTVTGVGDCEVTASQSGSSDYEAAEPKTSVIMITSMATKVTLTPAKKTSKEEKKIKFKAVVSAAQAGYKPTSGTVSFYINGTLEDSQALNKQGIASYIYYVDLPVSAVGYPVTAVFTSGDGDYSSSTSNTTTLKIKA